MAKGKSSANTRKITFGKRRKGKACKSFNKHDSRSTYHKQSARRSK